MPQWIRACATGAIGSEYLIHFDRAHRLAQGRGRALAAGLHPRRHGALDRLAALGGGAFDDCQEAEFASEIKAQAEGARRLRRNNRRKTV